MFKERIENKDYTLLQQIVKRVFTLAMEGEPIQKVNNMIGEEFTKKDLKRITDGS